MLFMVIEHFHDGAAPAIYARFCARGRLLPPGVSHVASWVETDLARCFQVMECERREQLDAWMSAWSDLTDFEVIPVLTSAEAAQRVGPGAPN